ncbi:MAG: hypothetical protein GY757_33570 [bacterium]|nr:hypothetical protein [bacterium]
MTGNLTRKDLLDDLNLDMTDGELELKLEALVKADIINEGQTSYRYQGVKDNIFDKVFRGVYEEEIQDFDIRTIKKEYSEELEILQKRFDSLLGKHNYMKAEDYCREKGIACCEDERWLESGKPALK